MVTSAVTAPCVQLHTIPYLRYTCSVATRLVRYSTGNLTTPSLAGPHPSSPPTTGP